MFKRLSRLFAASTAAAVIGLSGAGSAFASHGADDPAGHHHEHGHGHKHHHHHHGHHHHGGADDGANHG